MVCFQTKNPNLGKFWRALEWKMLLYFMIIWNILWPFGMMYGSLVYVVCGHLVYFCLFGMFGPRKIWQPWFEIDASEKIVLPTFDICTLPAAFFAFSL
jgi:hypothetical protein